MANVKRVIQKVFSYRGLIGVGLTLLLLLVWSGISILFSIIAAMYFLYRIFHLFTHSFTCPTCVSKAFVGGLILLLALGLTHPLMLPLVLAVIWIEVLRN